MKKSQVFVLFGYDAEQPVPRALPGILKKKYKKLSLSEKQNRWVSYLRDQIWQDADLERRSRKELITIAELRNLFSDFGGEFTSFALGRWLEYIENKFGKSIVQGAFQGVDVQSHSFSHGMWRTSGDKIRDSIAAPASNVEEEVSQSIATIERILGVRPIGIRPPMGSLAPLGQTNPELLQILQKNKITFLSSWLKHDKKEANSVKDAQPFSYSKFDFSEILEIPACGMFDVHWRNPTRLLIFDDEQEPSAEEMLRHYLGLLKTALSEKGPKTIVSLVFHPWAIAHYDPDLSMHRQILQYCQNNQISVISHRKLREILE